jgi:hypothetical protein
MQVAVPQPGHVANFSVGSRFLVGMKAEQRLSAQYVLSFVSTSSFFASYLAMRSGGSMLGSGGIGVFGKHRGGNSASFQTAILKYWVMQALQ